MIMFVSWMVLEVVFSLLSGGETGGWQTSNKVVSII